MKTASLKNLTNYHFVPFLSYLFGPVEREDNKWGLEDGGVGRCDPEITEHIQPWSGLRRRIDAYASLTARDGHYPLSFPAIRRQGAAGRGTREEPAAW